MNVNEADELVKAHQYKSWWWDGWVLCRFQPSPVARYDKNGVYYNGEWGFLTRYAPNAAGEYDVDSR